MTVSIANGVSLNDFKFPIFEVQGLISDLTDTATRLSNINAIRAAANSLKLAGGGTLLISNRGNYHLGGYVPNAYTDFPAMVSLPNNTSVVVGAGVQLMTPARYAPDNSKACPVFANENCISNAVGINVANTVRVAGDQTTYRYDEITLETTSAHSFTVDGYLYLKGDTSSYGWNGCHKVYAVPDSTHVTIRIYYREGAARYTIPSGSVVAYPANNNITIRIDGSIVGKLNTWYTNYSAPSGTIYFNKVGIADVSGNFDGCVVGIIATNFDLLSVPKATFDNCSIGIWASGPYGRLDVETLRGSGTEELIYTYNKEASALSWDADGTQNNGGNIGSVDVRTIYSSNNNVRAFIANAGYGYTINSIRVGKIYADQIGNVVELACVPGTSGTLRVIEIGEIVHSPDVGAAGIFINPNSTANLVINKLKASIKTGSRPYVDGWAIKEGDCTTGSVSINRLDLDIDTVHDLTASAATQTCAQVAGTGYSYGHVRISGRFAATGSTRSYVGVDVSSNITSASIVEVADAILDSPKGSLAKIGKNVVFDMRDTTAAQASDVALIQATESCTIKQLGCHCPSGMPLINFTGNNKAWNWHVGGSKTGDYACKGYSGASGNTINIWSLGGNSDSALTRMTPDKRSGTVISFNGNCADFAYDADVTYCGRKDGAMFYNTNTALGTLGAAGLVVGQGTAANSWRLMGDPTKQY